MTEQPGPRDPAERRTPDRPGKGVDVFGDLQRWFIRQSAKNMRREISGQMRRTFGGGGTTSDVWDTATNEIPPEVGESPECQWCPICRAARRMRDSGPGIGGQLSGAGDVVASAVQDAISALDSLLGKASGTGSTADTGREGSAGDGPASDSSPRDSAPRESTPSGAAGTSATSGAAGTSATPGAAGASATSGDSAASSPGNGSPSSAMAPDHQHGTSGQPDHDRAAPDSRRDRHGLVGLPGGGDSAATEDAAGSTAHGNGSRPAGGSADRLATARGSESDPWSAATDPAGADQDTENDDHSDGPGHAPDDRR